VTQDPTNLFDRIDDFTTAIYLEVPGSKVVLFQAYFELFEGLGLVRTLSIQRSLVCILTTPDLAPTCLEVLHAIQDTVPWRIVERPAEAEAQLYIGYFAKRT
jgi:hypothetical protein